MLKVQEIREIIKLIDESSINEFTYETNESTVIIKKPEDFNSQAKQENIVETNSVPSKEDTQVIDEQPTDVAKEKEIQKEIEPATQEPNYDHEIVSPMVGTFYEAPSPESDPYVKVGDEIREDTVVCIVEAMKLFNEIEAEVSGKITEVLVNDGELVEYGQPLFRVKTT